MKLSNALVGILNLVTAVLAVPLIGAGIWLATKHKTDCASFLEWPVIIIGIIILVISLAGLVGSCCRVVWLLWLYLVVMFLLILLLICFTIFAFAVTNKGAGQLVSGKGFDEYRLGDYSTWLQRQVTKASNWEKIQSCLSDSEACSFMDADFPTVVLFDQANLTPVQSGCCKPPTSCGFTYVNATNWSGTIATNATAEQDCTTWNNDATLLCYSCDSCKAGVMQNLKQDWHKIAIVNVVVLVFLIIVYSVGCCAFRNAKRQGRFSK